MPLVSILILNWNGKAHLINCLKSLASLTYPRHEVVVVDNGSNDGSVAYMRKHFPGVIVVANSEDFGFAKGNNVGIPHTSGKYVILLNNDTLVDPGFIEPLVARAESDNRIAVVQPKIVFAKNKLLQSGCSYLTATGFLYYTGFSKDPDDPKYNTPGQMYSGNGSCMLIRRSVIDRIGLFDETYFSYFEETDFCHRAWLSGWTIWYEPKGTIFHFGGMDNSREKPLKIQFHMYRNRISSYLKNFEYITLIRILPVHLMIYLLYAVFSMIRGKWNAPLAVTKAVWWNIMEFPETIRKRRVIQGTYRNVSDRAFHDLVFRSPRASYYYYLVLGLANYRDD